MSKFTIPVEMEIENIHFCWYDKDTIYVQFDDLPIQMADEYDPLILEQVNKKLNGALKAVEITSECNYCQASIDGPIDISDLCEIADTNGWTVSNEQ